MIRVVIAESVHLFRSGLVALLEDEPDITVAGSVERGRSLSEAAGALPEVALIGIDLCDVDGITAMGLLHAAAPQCAAIIMAARRRPGDLRRAVTGGALGFVLKDTSPAELVDAIRRVARGERVIDAELAFAEIAAARNPLTPRELDVLEAMADGATVGEIAEQLYLSSGTVRNYLARILNKVGARTRVEAVSLARKHGWLWRDGREADEDLDDPDRSRHPLGR
ncbi:response regulator transcription factor [Spirillospora sp. NPDC050679]